MNKEEVKRALLEAMKESAFQDVIREQVREAVSVAVAEAVSAKDAEIKELKEELAETKVQLNTLEQYSRRLCVNISGIPEATNEDTDQLITDAARLAGVTLAPQDIDRSHRIGTYKPGKIRTIVARFTNFRKRQQLFDARKKLRQPAEFPGSTVSAQTAAKIFIADNLTRDNQYILYKARQFRKEGKLYAAWSDVGKLKVRQRENSPTKVIQSVSDLLKIVETSRASATTDKDGYTIVTRQRAGGQSGGTR